MNNAANNIDAQSRSLKDVLFEKHYKVGYFQREYKWKRNHIEDLLVDLERSFNANWEEGHIQQDVARYDRYYMGPIVLFLDDSEFSIVDGQQRITSFILLMIFLNKRYEGIIGIQNKYEGYIYSEYFGVSSYNMNIAERDQILNYLHKGEEFDEILLKNESCKTILERYLDIAELFPPSLLGKDVFPLFTNWLTEKLVFVEIATQTSESAYTIFETMNDRGLNLTQTELLKSFLLSNVRDEEKIKDLDLIWKNKISILNTIDDDQDFFKAWLRGKFAVTIRTTEKDSENKDFEKIGTRFSSWTQENTKVKDSEKSKLHLDIKDADSFYFFVKSDFNLFSEIYIDLKNAENSENIPEPRIKLIAYRGVSQSLSYPLILSPILKTDNEETIKNKTEITIKYLDSFGVYRMLLSEPVTHSSIRNGLYLKVKEIRDAALDVLTSKLSLEVNDLRKRYMQVDYTQYNANSRYVLARIFGGNHPNIPFENIYFMRRKESYALYQFLKNEDFETDKHGLPRGLKDKLMYSVCSYTIVPRNDVSTLNDLNIFKRIEKILSLGDIFGTEQEFNPNDLKSFFIKREKLLKDKVLSLWKI